MHDASTKKHGISVLADCNAAVVPPIGLVCHVFRFVVFLLTNDEAVRILCERHGKSSRVGFRIVCGALTV